MLPEGGWESSQGAATGATYSIIGIIASGEVLGQFPQTLSNPQDGNAAVYYKAELEDSECLENTP